MGNKDVARGSVTVTVMGLDLQVACPEDKRADLLKAASFLDEKMREIRKNGRVIEPERCAIIAALNISYELLEERARREAASVAEDKIHNIENMIESALSEFKLSA